MRDIVAEGVFPFDGVLLPVGRESMVVHNITQGDGNIGGLYGHLGTTYTGSTDEVSTISTGFNNNQTLTHHEIMEQASSGYNNTYPSS